jgi:hypothetical protein
MARTLRKRIVSAVNKALITRDRIELRAIDALLSTVEPPRRRRTDKRRKRTPKRRGRS